MLNNYKKFIIIIIAVGIVGGIFNGLDRYYNQEKTFTIGEYGTEGFETMTCPFSAIESIEVGITMGIVSMILPLVFLTLYHLNKKSDYKK